MKKEMFEWIDWNSGVTEAWTVATSKTDGVALTAVVSLAVTFTAQALALPTANYAHRPRVPQSFVSIGSRP